MFRKICWLFGLCVLASSVSAQVKDQKQLATPDSELNDRQKDGLLGPVRRVTIETAKVTFRNGEATEGPRVLRAVTTYDLNGKKVDAVAHPVEEALNSPGKEQYKYDAKGNLIEMQMRGLDGSILSKETYKYKFDELGNWKQMTTSVAIFQDGKIGEEPVEVTYRAIAYFYNQEVAKVASGSGREVTPPTNVVAANVPNTASKPAPKSANTEQPRVVELEKTTPPSNPSTNTSGASNSPDSGSAAAKAKVDSSPSAPNDPTSLPVRRVSEEVLRRAAISLPQPSYPPAAELSRSQGRVSVELIVDEKGSVTNARATSENPLLNEAAETAARATRFLPASLSQEPARVTGILNYDFVLPEGRNSPQPTSRPIAEEAKKTERAESVRIGNSTANVSSDSPAVPARDANQPADALYNQGVSYLDAGNFSEAAQVLKQAVHKNPEFAPAYLKLGVAYASLRQYKEAVAVFKMAIQIKPETVGAEAYYQLGHSYTAIGKHSEALNAFKQALYSARADTINGVEQKAMTTPSAAELHYSLGLAYSNLGRLSEAIKELKQVLEINPQMAEAYFGLAVCYIGQGDRKSAEKQQQILTTLNPTLAKRIAQALAGNNNLPPGVVEGMLGGKRRN